MSQSKCGFCGEEIHIISAMGNSNITTECPKCGSPVVVFPYNIDDEPMVDEMDITP